MIEAAAWIALSLVLAWLVRRPYLKADPFRRKDNEEER